jgi:hypothetical protein
MNFLTFHAGEQAIGQLEKMKGGYFYLTIEAAIINQFERKRHTRLVCHLDEKISYQCGLNHLGDGNFSSLLRENILNNWVKKWVVSCISRLKKTQIRLAWMCQKY